MSSPINRELVLLTIHFLRENNMMESAHSLERESGLFFDMKYFEEMVLAGKLDESEKYFSGFTQIYDNLHSTMTYFQLRRQKFFEALDKHDKSKAFDILMKDFKPFSPYNEDVFKEATLLFFLDNFRQHPALANYGDPRIERRNVMIRLKQCIIENPVLIRKLQFPMNTSICMKHLIMSANAAAAAANNAIVIRRN